MAVYAGNDQNEIPRISPDYVPPQSAGEKFPISFWNYRYVGEGMTPDEVFTWAELGLTVSMAPKVKWNNEEMKKELHLYLDNAVKAGIPMPAMSSALQWFDGYTSERLPANLLQAQRDYFGAHMYERTDAPRGEFFHTDWTGHGGDVASTVYNA